jgi:hypothetical protein
MVVEKLSSALMFAAEQKAAFGTARNAAVAGIVQKLEAALAARLIEPSSSAEAAAAFAGSNSALVNVLEELGASPQQTQTALAALITATYVGLFAGSNDPEHFASIRKSTQQKYALNARERKLPPHILDRIVLEEMEGQLTSARDVAATRKPRRLLLDIAERKRVAINARIASERKRYHLSSKAPYYADADSIVRRYRVAKKRIAI